MSGSKLNTNGNQPQHKSLDVMRERAHLSQLRAEQRRAEARIDALKRRQRERIVLMLWLVIIILLVSYGLSR